MDPTICRVCGLKYDGYYPWGPDGTVSSFDICDCCGTEFGYEDFTLEGTKAARQVWIDRGAVWFRPKEKPANWSLEEQLKNIPPKYR